MVVRRVTLDCVPEITPPVLCACVLFHHYNETATQSACLQSNLESNFNVYGVRNNPDRFVSVSAVGVCAVT